MIEDYDEHSSLESAALNNGVFLLFVIVSVVLVNTFSIVRCTKQLVDCISSCVAVANENWSSKSKCDASALH